MPVAQYTDRLLRISYPVEKKIPIPNRSSILVDCQEVSSFLQPGTQPEGFFLDKKIGDRINKMNEHSFILASFSPPTLEGVLNKPWNRS